MAGVGLENVSRVYAGGLRAVDCLTLDVRDGEFLVLVGPSGCGKSTTLRMIAGLERVTSGLVRIGGRDVSDLPAKDRDIAMVLQNYALYPHLPVSRNMGFGLELRAGLSGLRHWFWRVFWPPRGAELARRRTEIQERVRRTAHMLGLEHLLDRLPGQLSGGEQQRVALGRAIVREPSAFLLDEPLSNLDAKLRLQMRHKLKELHQQLGATMLYVTHDQLEAMTLGERIAVMDRGRLQQVGTPVEVYDRPANQFVAGFLGTPPMNFIVGNIVSVAGSLAFEVGQWSIPIHASRARLLGERPGVVLGVRPEDVRLATGRPAGDAQGRVTLIESLGDEMAVTVVVGQARGETEEDSTQAVTCKLRERTSIGIGERVSLCFAMERAHFFDAETGESLIRSS